MRKTVLAGLIAGALGIGGAQAAPLIFSLDGTGGNVISAEALDWAPTSFLAIGGNQAISNFLAGAGGTTTFDVLTHAKLTSYKPSGGGAFIGLPAGFTGEITINARFQEQVINANPCPVPVPGGCTFPSANFMTTGVGWIEMYYSAATDATDLTGSGFTDGTLIMRGDGVGSRFPGPSFGNFENKGAGGDLDQNGANDYAAAQDTVRGSGTQDEVKFGTTKFVVDSKFLQTAPIDFSLFFANISIALPYAQVDPSDCFNPSKSGFLDAAITAGTATGNVSQCNAVHSGGLLMSAEPVAATGYLPDIGAVNGLFGDRPDFMAQTDFNSSVSGSVPEPGMLALLGLAFAGLGLTTARRRRV